MVTHEEQYAKLAQKIIKLDDGKIVSEMKNPAHVAGFVV